MNPRKPIKQLPLDSGPKKNININKPNPKQNKSKNNFRPGHHYIASGKNEKLYDNNFYNNKTEHNNSKVVVDGNSSKKEGRNVSAPHFNKDKKNEKKINKKYNNNTFDIKLDHSSNKFNNSTIDARDDKKGKNNISFDRKYKIKKPFKNRNINHRINNIKQSLNQRINKKYYNNDLYLENNEPLFKMNLLSNTYTTIKTENNNSTLDSIKIKNLKSNSKGYNNMSHYKDIQAKQEKIAQLKKKLKNNDFNNTNLINQRLKNKIKSHNNYNSVNSNKNMHLNNTINYSQVNNINIENIENDEDDNNIVIDNEEKILKTDENLDFNENNNLNNLQTNTYRDTTPNKSIENNSSKNNYINNFDSNDKNNSKSITNYTKDNIQKDKSKKNMKRIVNIRNDKDKNFFKTNYNMYNSNAINSDKSKKKSKSKKIQIINYPKEDFHYNKSSNVFNAVNNNNNNLNKTNNYNKTIDNSRDKNLNKPKFNMSFDQNKNNSMKKMKINNNDINIQNKDIAIGKLIEKRIGDKSKINRDQHNKSLNYTSDKINSSKNKRIVAKAKNPEKSKSKELKDENEVERKRKNIIKIGCICHAGEVSYGKSKINQDNYFNYKINQDDLLFIGVCDGHGENGHYISEYLINHLPQDFQEAYFNLKQKEKKSFEDISLDNMTKTFVESFLKTDNNLNEFCNKMKKKKLMGDNIPNYFNCDYSGSTCVSILLKQKDINTVYIANVGDSRTIVIKENNNDNWTFEQLSRDHKPTEEDEHKRIIDADGEIEAIEDDNGNWTGPLRVWEKGSEGPGLAMTRTLGDKVGSKIGVVCTPEVFKYKIKKEDRAFIIASDGLWEYMSNKEVTSSVKILITNMRNNKENNEIDCDYLVNELFKETVYRWRQKEQGIDDITIIIVLLN